MGQFMSWIKIEDKNYYLTDKEINSDKWEELEKVPVPDFALSHEAIRRFHNLGSNDLKYLTNKYFWNGVIPKEMKVDWNSGNFDEMLNLLGDGDIQNILKNAPDQFAFWIIKNKESLFLENLVKNNFWIYRLAGYLGLQDYNAMVSDKKKDYSRINFIGASILNEPKLVLKSIEKKLFRNEEDNYKAIHLGTRRKYDTMKRDKKSAGIRLIAQSITKDYSTMLNDYYPWSRFVGIIETIYDREDELEIERPEIE
jgi:hypothetical protein